MGTKLHHHDSANLSPGSPAWAPPRPVAHRASRQVRSARSLLTLLIVLLLLALFLQPLRVRVDGQEQVLPRRTTMGQAATLLGVPATPGDLVDVNGLVLRTGGGRAPTLLRNGVAVTPQTRLHSGDRLWLQRGSDVVEPMRERATLLPAVTGAGLAEPALMGVRRVQVGLLSGKTRIDTTPALATVPAPAGKTSRRLVALTFDDGPWPSQTAQILATLRKHNARATFFVLGVLAHYHPAFIRQTVAEGSEIGLHSWNHENLARMSGAAVAANMARTQGELQSLLGKPIHLMRPPYGALSATATRALKGAGYRIVLWSADTNDWRRPGANVIYSRIMSGARNGAIILCHDGGGSRSGTIAAVARAVPALQARGYELATVSQVLGLQAVPQGGALVVAGQRHEVKPIEPGLGVLLDDRPLALPEAPVEVSGQLMLPAKALLEALGVKWQWSQEAQKLTVQGAMETLTLRLNSTKLEHQYGAAEQLPAPPVLYRGRLLMPLWVALQASGATALYDPAQNTLSLLSLSQGLQSTTLGQGPPKDWGKGVKWREYLKGSAR